MITWDRAYARLSKSREFASYFGKGQGAPPPAAFRFIAYTQFLNGLTPSTAAGGGSPLGATVGPQLQTFPSGAVILGITASSFMAQQAAGAAAYPPWSDKSRRDIFALSFAYTNDELITPSGLTKASALLGTGEDTIFPARELLIPPSQGILVSAASLLASGVALNQFVDVVFHCMVPRAVG